MTDYISSIDQDSLNSLCEEIGKYNKINPAYFDRFQVKRGLRNSDGTGVMAGLTKICNVQGYYVSDGERVPIDGRLIYRGIDVREIISGCEQEGRFGFEEVVWLLLFGTLPSKRHLEIFKNVLAESRELPNEFIEDMIMKAPSHNIMNKLSRSVLALYSYDENPDDISVENVLRQSIQLLAQVPMIMSYAYQVKRRNFYHESMYLHPVDKTLSTAESVLYSIRADKKFTPEEAHMLDICLMLHAEHGGGNNSTFATRVLTSSGTDTYSAISAGIGSLKGPKHGGANIKVAEMVEYIKQGVEDITDADQVADFLKRYSGKRRATARDSSTVWVTRSTPSPTPAPLYSRNTPENLRRIPSSRTSSSSLSLSRRSLRIYSRSCAETKRSCVQTSTSIRVLSISCSAFPRICSPRCSPLPALRVGRRTEWRS